MKYWYLSCNLEIKPKAPSCFIVNIHWLFEKSVDIIQPKNICVNIQILFVYFHIKDKLSFVQTPKQLKNPVICMVLEKKFSHCTWIGLLTIQLIFKYYFESSTCIMFNLTKSTGLHESVQPIGCKYLLYIDQWV